MPVFRRKTIRGVTYEMDHLEPLRFEVPNSEGILRSVLVSFSCHCFTAGLKAHHAPDLIYAHRGEKRAFEIDRHTLSLQLPGMITALGTRTVYKSTNHKSDNFFFWRQNPRGFFGPYLVFFNVVAAKQAGVQALMNVESAYIKPNMADRGSPVTFATLIDKTARNQRVPFGLPVTVKRK